MNVPFIYEDLSYVIIGVLYDVYNELGPGYKEIIYENGVAKGLNRADVPYRRQMPYTVTYRGEKIGRYFFDFLVAQKIILEIKRGDYFSRRNIHQVNEYLKASGLKLAILANFTSQGVSIKRIVNIQNNERQ